LFVQIRRNISEISIPPIAINIRFDWERAGRNLIPCRCWLQPYNGRDLTEWDFRANGVEEIVLGCFCDIIHRKPLNQKGILSSKLSNESTPP
jgi:hypothetical protein